MCVDPVMAVIAAVLAALAGVALFVGRRLAEKKRSYDLKGNKKK